MSKNNPLRQAAIRYRKGARWIRNQNKDWNNGFCINGLVRHVLDIDNLYRTHCLNQDTREKYNEVTHTMTRCMVVMNELARKKGGEEAAARNEYYDVTSYNDKSIKTKKEAIKFLVDAAKIYDERYGNEKE